MALKVKAKEQLIKVGRLHLRKTQINLVFRSVCTNFAPKIEAMVKRRWRCKPGQQPTELDKRIMYLENKGVLVPTPDLIKTPEQIEGIRRAGVVNTGVLDAVGK